jgi:biotin carboxyl carrier protein
MKKLRFSIGGKSYQVEIEDPSASTLLVVVNGKGYTVCREDLEPSVSEAQVSLPVVSVQPDVAGTQPGSAESLAVAKTGAHATGSEAVRAPIPGRVLAVAVDVGDRVRYSDALCTLEAMKMESVIRAPVDGTVQDIRVKPGDSVQYDDVLVVLGKPAG